MKNAKKIEIIIESIYLPYVLDAFEALSLPGYTIINGIAGRGLHGIHDAQDFTDVSANSYIMIICEPDKTENLVSVIRSELEKYGGICLLSDIQQIIVASNKAG